VALLAPGLMPVSLLMLMIPLNVYVAWREWEALDRSGVTWTTVGRFLGTFGGPVAAHDIDLEPSQRSSRRC
jgi:hypothetical protein